MKKSTKIIFLGALSVFLSACQKPADDAAIIEAAKAGYTAFQQGDMAAWAATQASDVEWIAPKSLPYAGTYYGPDAVMENVFTPILELWPEILV